MHLKQWNLVLKYFIFNGNITIQKASNISFDRPKSEANAANTTWEQVALSAFMVGIAGGWLRKKRVGVKNMYNSG